MIGQENGVVVDIICIVLTVATYVLLARVILSFAILLGFRPPMYGPWRRIIDLLHGVTEPVLRPLRSLIPPVRAGAVGLDLSVMVAFVILFVLRVALSC